MIRTHEAGTLRAADAGTTVTLAGWVARRRDHGGVASSSTCATPRAWSRSSCRDEASARPAQRVLRRRHRRGRRRPAGNENADLPTGEVEVVATTVEVLSESAPLPFPIDDHVEVGEEVRLQVPLPRPAPHRPGPRAAAAQPGQPARPRGAARPRLPRDRDADADPVDARGRPRLPGAGPAAARHLVRPAAVAAAVQAAADGRPGWSGTTRSPAATATRTSAPTGSRSSPSSTSR